MDLAIPFRLGPKNSIELRYTLRSMEANLVDLEDGECFLLSHEAPDWYTGGLVVSQDDHKLSNISKVVAKLHNFVCHYGGDAFCFANDDTFILKPWSGVRYWNKRATPAGYHAVTVSRSKFLLEQNGHKFAHDYELHVPLIVRAKQARELLHEVDYKVPIAFRTLYCNTYPEVEFGIPDCKIMGFAKPPSGQQFLSTDDAFASMPDLHKWLQEKYPRPSRWEK